MATKETSQGCFLFKAARVCIAWGELAWCWFSIHGRLSARFNSSYHALQAIYWPKGKWTCISFHLATMVAVVVGGGGTLRLLGCTRCGSTLKGGGFFGGRGLSSARTAVFLQQFFCFPLPQAQRSREKPIARGQRQYWDHQSSLLTKGLNSTHALFHAEPL